MEEEVDAKQDFVRINMRECVECGKEHNRLRFCSPRCGNDFNNKRRSLENKERKARLEGMTASQVDYLLTDATRHIDDDKYCFVFSKNIIDWTVSKNRQYQKKRIR